MGAAGAGEMPWWVMLKAMPSWGDARGRGNALGGVTPAPSPPSRSLKRVSEEKEQQLALVEDGRAAADREVTELRAALRELERARLDARRELQELRRQVRRMMGEPPSFSPVRGAPRPPTVSFWGR